MLLSAAHIAIISVGGAILLLVLIVAARMAKGGKLPANRPSVFAKQLRKHREWLLNPKSKSNPDKYPSPNPNNLPVVVFYGDSHTQGTMCINYLEEIEKKYKGEYIILNAGINGEQTAHIYDRINSVIQCEPQLVYVMAGSNDRLGNNSCCSACAYFQCFSRIEFDDYQEDYRTLLTALAVETRAFTTILTVPPIEAPHLDSINMNGTDVINEIAANLTVEMNERYPGRFTLLDVATDYDSYIKIDYHSPTPKIKWTPGTFISNVMRAQFLKWVIGFGYDEIAQMYKLKFTVDTIHFNSDGAGILTKHVDKSLLRLKGRVNSRGVYRSAGFDTSDQMDSIPDNVGDGYHDKDRLLKAPSKQSMKYFEVTED